VADRFAEIEKRIDSDDMLTAEQRAEIKERARVHVKKKPVERLTDQLFNEACIAKSECNAGREEDGRSPSTCPVRLHDRDRQRRLLSHVPHKGATKEVPVDDRPDGTDVGSDREITAAATGRHGA
jgi:hypothetical protein